jgi:hypothetical protein
VKPAAAPTKHTWMASIAQSPPLEFVQFDSAAHCQPWYLSGMKVKRD